MGRTSDTSEELLPVGVDPAWNQSHSAVGIDQIYERADANKTNLAMAAWGEDCRKKQSKLGPLLSVQVLPWEHLKRWCDYLGKRQEMRAVRDGSVYSHPHDSLKAELTPPDEEIRTKIHGLVEGGTHHLESAVVAAQREDLIMGSRNFYSTCLRRESPDRHHRWTWGAFPGRVGKHRCGVRDLWRWNDTRPVAGYATNDSRLTHIRRAGVAVTDGIYPQGGQRTS